MMLRTARKLKKGQFLKIGGDIRGFVEKVNKKSITFREAQASAGGIGESWNLAFEGPGAHWNDVELMTTRQFIDYCGCFDADYVAEKPAPQMVTAKMVRKICLDAGMR